MSNYKMTGLFYVLISPIIHYLIYEVKGNNEYYYYFNLGFRKIGLWCSTIILGVVNLLIFSLL